MRIVVSISLNGFSLDFRCHTMNTTDILAPNARATAVFSIVGNADSFFFSIERNQNTGWAKYFFTHNAYVQSYICANSRLDVWPLSKPSSVALSPQVKMFAPSLAVSKYAITLSYCIWLEIGQGSGSGCQFRCKFVAQPLSASG
jgi:hypothetical protein